MDPNADPVFEQDPTDFFTSFRRQSVNRAVTSLTDDPEKAARASELSRATNTPAPVIYGDLENFELQHKAKLTADLLNNNEYLRSFIDRDPMAAKTANDDYGNLDAVSQKVTQFKNSIVPKGISDWLGSDTIAQGAVRGFGEEPVGFQFIKPWKDHEFLTALTASALTVPELALRSVNSAIYGASYGVLGPELGEKAAQALTDPALQMSLQGVGPHGAIAAAGLAMWGKIAPKLSAVRPFIESGKEPPPTVLPEYDAFRAERNAKDVEQLSDVVKDAQSSTVRERNPDLFRDFIREHTDAEIGVSGDAIAMLYGDKVPSVDDGLLGWAPKIAEQLELARRSGDDVSIPLADWVAHVDPEVMKTLADDIRVRPGAITAREVELQKAIDEQQEAIRVAAVKYRDEVFEGQIHGDAVDSMLKKYPEFNEDGKFPHDEFSEGFLTTKERYVDREEAAKIAKSQSQLKPVEKLGALESQIKSYDDVNTLMAEDLLPSRLGKAGPKPPPLPEELPTVRAASALEPLFSIGDRKLKLERMKGVGPEGVVELGFHDFNLLDEKGQNVGTVNLSTQKGGKQLYVDMINGINGLGPRDFGPALMRDLLRQIKAEFPDAETITGHRVSGARDKAGSYMAPSAIPVIKLDKLDSLDHNAFREILEGGQWETYSPNIKGYIKPDALRSEQTRQLVNIVNDELDRIVPKKVAVQGVETIKAEAKGVEGQRPDESIRAGGVYIAYRDSYPMILYALDSDNALGSARHEAIHHLRRYGFFKPGEWETLEAQALAGNWFKKYKIDDRYPTGSPSLKLEEAIAEAYPEWARQQDTLAARAKSLVGIESPLDAIFRRMKEFFDNIKQRISDLLGKDATWEDVFQKVDTGEVGAREGTQPIDPRAFNEALNVQGPEDPSRVFERANSLGMSIDQYKRYEKLIEQRHVEDIESASKRAEAAQRKVQTQAWKDDRKAMRAQVVDEINLRPDIAADNYFADGMLYGNKIADHDKLGTDFLTEQQRAMLPRDYYRKDGVHPDDLAPLFGYPDGASLVQHLAGLSEIRRTSGMRPIEFKRRMIDIETDRQMRLKHGVLEDNIMDAVKEQVASETQLNLLHEETVALGMRSGETAPFDQTAVKQWVADEFERSPQTSVNSDRYLATAGRAGKAAEMALLKEDPATAFREKQRQYYATLLAKHAIEFEAKQAKFEKLATRLAKREVPAVEPEYLDFIHELMGEAGMPIKRGMEEVASSKTHYGNEGLAEFAASKSLEGWDLAISDDLAAGKVKSLDQMSVGEMQDFMDAVTSLNYVGRAVRKIEIAGEKADWAEFRTSIINNINQLPERSRASQGNWLYQIDASLTRMEEIAKDLDLRTELGPLHQAVIEPMMRSKAKEFDLMTSLSKHFQDTRGDFGREWRKSLDETIPQDVLHDPYTDAAYDMTRQNLIQVMLNWGNRSNIGKFVQGAAMAKFGRRLSREEFPQFEAQIKALIDKHATAQDWQFVQRMWEPFKDWQQQMDTVSRNTSGVTPKWINVGQVETPHGTFEGGYWPVKYDRLGSNALVVEDRKPQADGVFGGNYFRAATSKGYLKERTGYVDFVDISTSLEQAAGTMQQTIHDIAFRDSLIQAGKVFYDKGIRAAIRKHYGSEYEAQLVPWLRRIANQFSTDDASISGINDFLRRVRINLVGHALPFNLKVILSPDIGVPDPKAWASYLANRGENTKLAMEKSDEIRHLVYNMDRDYRESLDKITINPNTGDLQKKAVQWGFLPIAKVSQEFRVSTFVDQYQKALGRGKTEQEAALIADSFVRERHGAASVVDLPAIMQSNEGMKMLTMFYGYFNTMYNWQRQLPGNARRGEAKNFMVNGLGSVVVGAGFGAALFNQRKQDDSWWKIIGKAMLLQPLSTIPVLNTAASYFAEGYSPRTPIASLLGAAGSIITDAKKLAHHERIDKPVQHVANVIGLSTGLPLAQIGRTGQFAADVVNKRQRPKNIADWARGIITGEAQLKR